MSYKINKTDGILLVDLVDGRIDVDTTDITLIGRNYSGYGELFNENFVKILENFAAVSPPSNPLVGQLWYDTSSARLTVWNGTQFRSTDTTVVSAIEPTLLSGDIWIDSRRQQLYFNDGTGTTLAGPLYTRAQGPTGFKVDTINDRFGNPKTVAKIIVNSSEVALISRESFQAGVVQPGFGRDIGEGINLSSNYPDFEFRGTASRARQLIDASGDPFEPENFIRSNVNSVTTGTFHVNNNAGLRVGRDISLVTRMEIFPNAVVDDVINNNANYRLRVNANGISTDAIFINTENQSIGIWNNTPDPNVSLNINGTVKINGDLIIEGDAIQLDVNNLRVQDKLIELAATGDFISGNNSVVDGSGIVVLSSDNNKEWIWRTVTNSWTANTNIDITVGSSYRVNGAVVLTENTLGPTVTSAPGLTQLGTLTTLDVANFNFSSSTITATDSLTLNSASDIIIANNRRITNLGTPTSAQDAATKSYVDSLPIYMNLDITGLNNSAIETLLGTLIPSVTRNIGTPAYISTSVYSGTSTTNPTTTTNKTFVNVDAAGIQNQAVIADFSFSDQISSLTLTVIRGFKTFRWNGTIWQFEADSIVA